MRSVFIGALLVVGAVSDSNLAVTWSDCGDGGSDIRISNVQPSIITVGTQTRLTATGFTYTGFTGGSFKLKNKWGWTGSDTFVGDICASSTHSSSWGDYFYEGVACPVPEGEAALSISFTSPRNRNAQITLTGVDEAGNSIVCLEMNFKKFESLGARDEWAEWKARFGKTYNGDDEEATRFEIFSDNLDYINSENAKGLSYNLATNMFSDLTVEEFSRLYMGYVEPTKSFGSMPYLGEHVVTGEGAPASVDWTLHGAVTPVKNQAQCGSCWTFSTTGGLEGAYKIAGNSLVPLSEQQFVDCAKSAGNGCEGGSMYNAYEWAMDNDVCLESAYPYEGVDSSCRSAGCAVGVAKGVVAGVKSVNHWIFSASEDALMSAIAQQPVSIAIEADQRAFQSYSGGVLAANAGCGTALDHGVLAVGYGTDSQYGDYWKVKNSWSSGWGENGYIRLARGNGGAGTCGLLKQPVYPVISSSVVV